jgi:hypothetical protein
LGRSPDAIRSAIRRGKLQARKGNDGDWRVILPADRLAVEAGEADSLLLLVDSLRAELKQERRQPADRQATVEDLRERVGRLEGEVAAADMMAQAKVEAARDAAEAKVAASRVEVAAMRELADRLTAELKEARKSWWQRVFGL